MIKKEKKVEKIIILFALIICVFGVLYSTYSVISWKMDNNRNAELQKKLKKSVTVNNNGAEGNNKTDEVKEFNLDDYFVDFGELKKINSEIVAYIKVPGTNIDSTIVKHKDNDFYLTHSFDKKWNSAGWIFSHYRNKYNGTDKNYVIFGHSRKDGSMFGTLKNILTKDWLNENYKVLFITEDAKRLYEVFSVYKIEVEDYYIKTDFSDDEEFKTFIDTVKSRSIKDFKVDVDINDRLLTLSTCSEKKYRIVLHAKELVDD